MLNWLSTTSWRHVGEWRYSSTIFDLGTRRECSISRPGRFTPWERAPGTHWVGGWAGPRTRPNAVEKRKISCLFLESNPSCPARSQLLYRLSYPDSMQTCNVTNRPNVFNVTSTVILLLPRVLMCSPVQFCWPSYLVVCIWDFYIVVSRVMIN
jgi:hypothetical protein